MSCVCSSRTPSILNKEPTDKKPKNEKSSVALKHEFDPTGEALRRGASGSSSSRTPVLIAIKTLQERAFKVAEERLSTPAPSDTSLGEGKGRTRVRRLMTCSSSSPATGRTSLMEVSYPERTRAPLQMQRAALSRSGARGTFRRVFLAVHPVTGLPTLSKQQNKGPFNRWKQIQIRFPVMECWWRQRAERQRQ